MGNLRCNKGTKQISVLKKVTNQRNKLQTRKQEQQNTPVFVNNYDIWTGIFPPKGCQPIYQDALKLWLSENIMTIICKVTIITIKIHQGRIFSF